jgi:hypothetical protein
MLIFCATLQARSVATAELAVVTAYPAAVGAYVKLSSTNEASWAVKSGAVTVGSSSNPNSSLVVYGTLKGADLSVGSDDWTLPAPGQATCPAGTYFRGIELAMCPGSTPPLAGACDIQILCTHL